MAPDPMPLSPIDADATRRLHPLSPLFVLLQHLRQFIIPLLALVLFNYRDQNALGSLIVICALALASVWRYYTYHYRIADDSILINSGLLQRNLRQIPFSRIQNVALHQSILHRLFGVAEVKLESAAGHRPEAQMRVLRLDDALALEQLIRRRSTAAAPLAEANAPLLALPDSEIVRLGLISNRGLVVLGTALVAVSQLHPQLPPDLAARLNRRLAVFAAQHLDVGSAVLLVLAALVGFVILLRVFSIVLALLQFHGFRLEEDGRRLSAERGLLTRVRSSVPRRRIQAFWLEETLLHRLFGRRTLEIDTAVAERHREHHVLRELAPIAMPARCDAIAAHLLPLASWPPAQWQPLHPGAWWRLALPGTVFAALLATALCWRYGAWGLLGGAWWPWAVFVARRHAQRAGYACDARLVAFRHGWIARGWRFAQTDKLQVVSIRRSPLDRLGGMATLWLDTAGAGAHARPLRIRFMRVDQAQALLTSLTRELARRPLRW